MEFFQINIFVILDKVVKYIKSFKIEGSGCYDINVAYILSPEDGLLELKIRIPARFWFFLHLKRKQ